jgi:hypothetical protein
LHVHAAEPLVTVHVWLVLGHAPAEPNEKQPLLPITHVAMLPDTHSVCGGAQLLVQLSAHAAFGGNPEHDSRLEHGAEESSYGHPLPSTRQVASV